MSLSKSQQSQQQSATNSTSQALKQQQMKAAQQRARTLKAYKPVLDKHAAIAANEPDKLKEYQLLSKVGEGAYG